ncbi:rhodanese-like domain-containing protein [Ornithinibacillus sp. 4-3]|uniref:Rhodanese-like domain-containing protein n=1 Tax=Ornithinibacillus sp. 4-3 TaxID=3231488 RepID=A0AB39HVS8_9BACI
MNIVDIIRISLVVIVLFFILKRFLPVDGMKVITSEELNERLKHPTKYQFIDVSIAREYKNFHIKGFKSMPLRRIKRDAHQLSKEKETVIICQSGHISKEACRRLKKLGFTDLTIVKGGVSMWRK